MTALLRMTALDDATTAALDRFDWIVAENGALLYRPSDHFSQLLCAPASAALAQKLGEAQAQPLSVGRAIIATREPHEVLVIELIKQLGLELQIIFNKGASWFCRQA
jgi:hydroxymethylpyrimidine pyrophosphatase-like HAD family hydrolase